MGYGAAWCQDAADNNGEPGIQPRAKIRGTVLIVQPESAETQSARLRLAACVSPRALTYPSVPTPFPCVMHRAKGGASLVGCARVLGEGKGLAPAEHKHCLSSSLVCHSITLPTGAAPKGRRREHGGWYKVERSHTWEGGCCSVVVGAMCRSTKRGDAERQQPPRPR